MLIPKSETLPSNNTDNGAETSKLFILWRLPYMDFKETRVDSKNPKSFSGINNHFLPNELKIYEGEGKTPIKRTFYAN